MRQEDPHNMTNAKTQQRFLFTNQNLSKIDSKRFFSFPNPFGQKNRKNRFTAKLEAFMQQNISLMQIQTLKTSSCHIVRQNNLHP